MSFYNPLPVDKLLNLFNLKEEPDFLKSDYCDECGGSGYLYNVHENHLADNEREQCPTCESLHDQELKADRLQDELKGG